MKLTMKGFLALSESDKVKALESVEPRFYRLTFDKGKCFICGRKVGAGFYCFGCKRLICSGCEEKSEHINLCLG